MGIMFLILQEDKTVKKNREDHTANITAKLVGSFIFNGFLFPTLIWWEYNFMLTTNVRNRRHNFEIGLKIDL